MKIQKELVKISKDLEKMSRQDPKAYVIYSQGKRQSTKSQHAEASCTQTKAKNLEHKQCWI